ncbi:MAG: hypothetical protein AAF997_19935, partial [Myxococcota bacterium]
FVGDDTVTRGLRLIGFIPEAAESATEDSIELQIASVAAYYSSRSKSITIIDRDYPDEQAQEILAHEFVHFFQDRAFGLGSVFSGAATTDSVMGRRLVIEGDATYVAADWLVREKGLDVSAEDWEVAYNSWQGFALRTVGDPEVAIDQSAGIFPYAYGYELLGRASQSGGLPGRAALFESPPDSARDGMVEYQDFVSDGTTDVDEPNEPIPDPPESELLIDDRSGAWYLYATLLRAGLLNEEAWARSLEWRGDRLGVFEAGSEVVAVWRIRTTGDPSFVAEAVALTPRDVLWTTVLDNNEAYVIAAESDAALATWESQPAALMAALVDSTPDVRANLANLLPSGCRANPTRVR